MPVLLLLLSLILTACQSDSWAAATPGASPTPTQGVMPTTALAPPPLPLASAPTASLVPGGSQIVLGLVGQPASLNPITDNNPALAEITPLLFESLLQVNPDTAQLQPGLARRWEYSNNGKQVTFYLPSNLKWSNGAPLTAAGLANSLKATAHPALLAFSRINAPNAQTLRLTFAKIDCAALTTLATLPLLPADQVAEPMPTGSGPFSIVDWSENKRTLTLSRNPHYRGPAPWLDNLTIRFIQPDQITLVLSESKFDLVGPLESSTINLQPANQQILSYPAPHLIHLAINYSPRNNLPLPPKVQQALRLAIDREAILNEALGGQGQLLAGSLLPGHWAANAALTWPAHNPERASKLLAQAGLRDSDGDGWLDQAGQRLELSIRANGENPLYQNLGWLISSYYRDLGLFARAEGVSFDNLLDDLFTQDFTLALFSWPLQADPDQRQFWQSNQADEGIGLNFSSYKNSKLDNLLDQAVATPGCSLPARAKIYAEIQQILADERPADFLLVPNRHLLVTPRLSGLKPGPFVPFTWNVAEWYNEPE